MTSSMGLMGFLGNREGQLDSFRKALASTDDPDQRRMLEQFIEREEYAEVCLQDKEELIDIALAGDTPISDVFRSFVPFGSHELPGIIIPHMLERAQEGNANARLFLLEKLGELWTGINDLVGDGGCEINTILDAFRFTGFLTDGPERPTSQTVVIYRGASAEGLYADPAWSGSIDTARWFAKREASLTKVTSSVWKAEWWTDSVLGRFESRNEDEYTMDIDDEPHVSPVAVEVWVVDKPMEEE